MEIADLIARLGGPTAVARRFGIGHTAVLHWLRTRRVPARRQLALWRLAREAGVDWRPPGAEDIDIVVYRSQDDGDVPAEFAQCSGAPR